MGWVEPRSSPDDLLEFCHGIDVVVEDDEFAGFAVDTGGHEFGRGDDDRIFFLYGNEIIELTFALVIVAGDAHDVFSVFGNEVGVFIDEGLAHALGVVDVHAENDGFGEAIVFLEKLGDALCYDFGAVIDNQIFVVVFDVVFAVFDFFAVDVALSLFRAPAFEVFVETDTDDFVRREETVVNALLEAVGVDRFAEVVDVRDVLRFLRCSGQADLRGA